MKVQAIIDVRHGVTGQITCPLGSIYTVKRVIYNPPCDDLVSIGREPIRGAAYEFEEMPGFVHASGCFKVYFQEFKFLSV